MRRRLTILALVLGMVGALLATAVAVGQTEGPITVERGVLRLHLGADDYFRFDPADGLGGFEEDPVGYPAQYFTSSGKCEVLVPGPYAELTAPPGNVGLVDDGLGVRITGPKGTKCGQFDGSEVLVFKLGDELDGMKVDFAEIDFEIKFDATIKVEFLDEGLPLGFETYDCNPESDCGPDSTDGDNSRKLVKAPDQALFDEMRFSVVLPSVSPNAAASLEGGADGTDAYPEGLGETLNTEDSIFHIVQEFDGVLDCDDTVTEGGTGDDPGIEVRRAGVIVGCVDKPYNIDYNGAQSEASFEPTGPDAEFTALIVWPEEPAGALPVAATEIDFDGDGFSDPVQWCTGFPERDSGNPASGFPSRGFLSVESTGEFAGAPDLPLNGAPWCLLDQEVTYVDDGDMQVSEYYYGTGDPRWSR